ncbi:MAG TPA: PEP-CTERM sorting domain-containing protein [Caulobacteraceae bacterium]|jgi:hypothetical protein
MKRFIAVLILSMGFALPAAAYPGAGVLNITFEGVMTSGSDTEMGGSLVGLPFVAVVGDTPSEIINDGYNGNVVITPTSFYLGSYDGGPLGADLWIGGKFIGSGGDVGGYDELAGGVNGSGNGFYFDCCDLGGGLGGVGEFTPANGLGGGQGGSDFSISGSFSGTAPYQNPFANLSMASPGTGSVTFDATWSDFYDNNFHEIAGTAEITEVSVQGIPEPSTWATLVLGLALIGLVVRSRRAVHRPAPARRLA